MFSINGRSEGFSLQQTSHTRENFISSQQRNQQSCFDSILFPFLVSAVNNMRITEIDHPNHHHLLTLESPKIPFKCCGCQELGFGVCYSCEHCNYYIHKECALPTNPFYHPLFRSCDFEFHDEPPFRRICDACLKDVKGCAYKCTCKHNNPYDLHPCCAKLPNTLFGKNNVVLNLTSKIPSKCLKCLSKKNTREGAKGWSYVSNCGNYCLHVACAKEMIYDAWEKGYFGDSNEGHDGNSGDIDSSSLQVALPKSVGKELVSSSSLAEKAATKLRTVISVLTVIVSAIFGDPITMFTAVIIALARSMS